MITYKNLLKTILDLPSSLPIYIGGHIKPDQDSIGSCMALCKFLNSIDKKAFVLLEDFDKDIFSWQNDYSLIKNTVKEKDYVFFALDLNDKKRLGNFEKYFDNAKITFNIDHHQDNKNQAQYVLSNPGISSTCEMIFKLITLKDKSILKDKQLCECLYAGIMTDTTCFARRLSKNTLSIAQKLINTGIDYINIIKKTFANRTMYEAKAYAKLVDQLQCKNGVYFAVIDMSLPEFKNLTHNAITKKISEDLRKIEDIDIFLVLMKYDTKIVAKSMSNYSEVADKIAGLFGGGGHKKEAGFTTTDLTIEQIINKVSEYINKK